jgi:hypothetical protein
MAPWALGSLKLDDPFSVSGQWSFFNKRQTGFTSFIFRPESYTEILAEQEFYHVLVEALGQKAIGREKNVLINDPDSQY